MTESTKVDGRLVALNWVGNPMEATMAVDTTKLQEATAEIEDGSGVTHRIEVLAGWDADYLVGKDVVACPTDEGVVLSEK
ncbi:MAG: hypothetical protein QF718_08925 [Phycisphaerales bacterium]|jgi:hypothetical protein|nr:hypothetical protein [Phycisphaerales bacterium]